MARSIRWARERTVLGALALLVLASGCNTDRRRVSPGPDPMTDAGAMPAPDGALPLPDAGPLDSGPLVEHDGGSPDAGPADAGSPDAGPPDAGPPDAGPTPCAPAPGRLAIVEVMIASQSGTDRGEWFEVLNTSTCTVNLSGLVLESPTTAGVPVTHTVSMGTVAPGGQFVFALSGDPLENHGLAWDYVYGTGTTADLFLGNTGDDLLLRDASGREIDRVHWADGFTRGASRQFPRSLPAADNADWASWCDSVSVYSSTGGLFYGTPGARNGTCP